MAAPFVKASPNDPDHPGWPAGSPGGVGGQFMPKDAAAAAGVIGPDIVAALHDEAAAEFPLPDLGDNYDEWSRRRDAAHAQQAAYVRERLRPLLAAAKPGTLIDEAALDAAYGQVTTERLPPGTILVRGHYRDAVWGDLAALPIEHRAFVGEAGTLATVRASLGDSDIMQPWIAAFYSPPGPQILATSEFLRVGDGTITVGQRSIEKYADAIGVNRDPSAPRAVSGLGTTGNIDDLRRGVMTHEFGHAIDAALGAKGADKREWASDPLPTSHPDWGKKSTFGGMWQAEKANWNEDAEWRPSGKKDGGEYKAPVPGGRSRYKASLATPQELFADAYAYLMGAPSVRGARAEQFNAEFPYAVAKAHEMLTGAGLTTIRRPTVTLRKTLGSALRLLARREWDTTIAKFNPYHRGEGPGGGQFTNAENAGSVSSEVPDAAYRVKVSGEGERRVRSWQRPDVWYHGTPSGDLRGGSGGLHIGSRTAAKEALEARIGTPATGEWDGTREYGKTKLAGRKTLAAKGQYPTGVNAGGPDRPVPDEDYLPRPGIATYGDGTPVAMTAKPAILKVRLVGPMSNTGLTAYDDFKAGGYMSGALKRGHAKRGMFYENVSEDEGSISAVVPSAAHLKVLDAVRKTFERIEKYIVKREDGYHVLSESGKNLGGPYPTRAGAAHRLAQVEWFKRRRVQKFNPYHRGPGPGGGQFTNAEGGGVAVAGPARVSDAGGVAVAAPGGASGGGHDTRAYPAGVVERPRYSTGKPAGAELVEQVDPHTKWTALFRMQASYSVGPSADPEKYEVDPRDIDLEVEREAVRAAVEEARAFWTTSQDRDALYLRQKVEGTREPAPANREVSIQTVMVANPKDHGAGSGGPGSAKVFWTPYSLPNRKQALTAEGQQFGSDIDFGVDPIYVTAHELHHAFGFHSELDITSDVAALAGHLRFMQMGGHPAALGAAQDGFKTLHTLATSVRFGPARRAGLRYLHRRFPRELERLATMTDQRWGYAHDPSTADFTPDSWRQFIEGLQPKRRAAAIHKADRTLGGALRRLARRAWNEIAKMNPYHRGPGPGGGQFTNAEGGGGGAIAAWEKAQAEEQTAYAAWEAAGKKNGPEGDVYDVALSKAQRLMSSAVEQAITDIDVGRYEDEAIKEFGESPSPYQTGWITTGGTALDFGGGAGGNSRWRDHREVSGIEVEENDAIDRLWNKADGNQAMLMFMGAGHIRVGFYGGRAGWLGGAVAPGAQRAGTATIDAMLRPNAAQMRALHEHVDGAEEVIIDLTDLKGYTVKSVTTTPDELDEAIDDLWRSRARELAVKKAREAVEKFNPYHRPAGPGGGQFTSRNAVPVGPPVSAAELAAHGQPTFVRKPRAPRKAKLPERSGRGPNETAFEQRIAHAEIENGAIITADDKVLLETKGNSYSVPFDTLTVMALPAEVRARAHILHNHPRREPSGLSDGDIGAAVGHELAGVVAVFKVPGSTRTGEHRLTIDHSAPDWKEQGAALYRAMQVTMFVAQFRFPAARELEQAVRNYGTDDGPVAHVIRQYVKHYRSPSAPKGVARRRHAFLHATIDLLDHLAKDYPAITVTYRESE